MKNIIISIMKEIGDKMYVLIGDDYNLLWVPMGAIPICSYFNNI